MASSQRPTARASSTSPPTASRQPGSSFKPFVLTTAVDQGIDPDSTYYPAPSSITLYPARRRCPWTVERRRQRLDEPARRDRQLRSTPSTRSSAVDVGPENFTEMAKKMGITSRARRRTTPRRSAAPRPAAPCSRCRTPTRRSPTAASTTTRPRSRKVEFPNGEVDEPRGPRGRPRDLRRRRLHGRRRHGGDARLRHRGRLRHRLHGLRQDRHDRGAGRRLVRRLHAGRLDRGLDRQRRRARRRCPATAPTSRRRSGTTTWTPGSPKSGDCGDYPEPEDPAELSSYSSSQTASSSYEETSTTTDPEAIDDGTGDVPVAPGDDADGDGFPDDAYAPGADQDPAPTPDG